MKIRTLKGSMIAFSAIVALGCEDGGVNGVPALPPSSISVEPTRLDLRTGETQSITVNVLDSSGNPIENPILTFSSSDAAVAAVDNRGVVTGVGEGTAAISVEAEGLIAVLLVNVQAIVGSVEIDPETMTGMSVNEAGYLTVTVLDQHGEEIPGAVVEWSSDNEDVATVERVLSPFGGNHCGCDAVVIGIAKGTATHHRRFPGRLRHGHRHHRSAGASVRNHGGRTGRGHDPGRRHASADRHDPEYGRGEDHLRSILVVVRGR